MQKLLIKPPKKKKNAEVQVFQETVETMSWDTFVPIPMSSNLIWEVTLKKKKKPNMRGLKVKEFRRPKGQCGTIGKFTWKILSKSGWLALLAKKGTWISLWK